MNQDLVSKSEDRAMLTDSCEQTKAHLAELGKIFYHYDYRLKGSLELQGDVRNCEKMLARRTSD